MSIPEDLINNFYDKTKERQLEILQHAYDYVEILEARLVKQAKCPQCRKENRI